MLKSARYFVRLHLLSVLKAYVLFYVTPRKVASCTNLLPHRILKVKAP